MILAGLLLSALPILLAIIFGLCKSNSIESKMEYGIAAYPTRGTSQSPTGYRKRTAQILRATHFYDLLM